MKYFLAFFALFLASSAYAAAPVVYKVVPEESSIKFSIKQGTATITGEFPAFIAHIAFNPDALEASKADVAVDMGNIKVSDGQAGDMLPKDEWLNSKAFPQAKFVTDSFKSLGNKRYEADGKLTLKGVTLPMVLTFTLLEYSPAVARIMGEATLNRKDFHIGWDDTASVENAVKLTVAIKAVAP